MPRLTLKMRPDGRYACRFQNQWFYGDTQAEALNKRDAYKRTLQEGLRQEALGITVTSYALRWIAAYKANVAAGTYNAYAHYLNTICEAIGSVRMKDVTTLDIQEIYSKLNGTSASHIRKFCATCKSMFESALNDGLISRNPCAKARKPKGESGTHRVLTAEEDQLIGQMVGKHDFARAAMLMRYAGLRRGEVAAFDIDRDVDFDAGIVYVRQAVSFSANQPEVKSTKTAAGIREIPLFDPLRKAIEGCHGLICQNSAGGIMSETSITRKWESYVLALETELNHCHRRWYGRTKAHRALVANGGTLPRWRTVSLRMHDCRHSFCSMLYNAGVDIKTAMKWMGHADEKMILKVYAHLSSEKERASAHAVGRMLNESMRSQSGSQNADMT